MFEVAVVDQLEVASEFLIADSEIEASPGYEGGFVSKSGEIEIRFGVKFRHDVSPLHE
jgi:hypothetical protein